MSKEIDYRRGVRKRVHPASGVEIFMYKDQPGVFLNAFGKEVGEDIAHQAGYNVDKLKRAKLRQERMELARQTIEEELEASTDERRVVYEVGDYVLVDVGEGRTYIEDVDGNRYVGTPMPFEQAKTVVDSMAGKEGLLKDPDAGPEPEGGEVDKNPTGTVSEETEEKQPTEAAKDVDPGPMMGEKPKDGTKPKKGGQKDGEAS